MRVTRRTMLGGLVSSGLWTPFSASTEPLFPSDRNGGTSNGVQAERIASFLDIIGVNGHIGSNGTPYLNIKGIVADTAYIGARKWRDSLRAQNSWQLEPLKALVSAGLSLIGVPLHSQTIAVDDHITRARVWAGLGTNALLALDGPYQVALIRTHGPTRAGRST
jgi:hypothetical protein